MPDETTALKARLARLGGPRVDKIEQVARDYMTACGLPVADGEYWCNDDGSRWAVVAAGADRPAWATALVAGHPAARLPEGSPERDAWDILYRCDLLRRLKATGAPAEEVEEQVLAIGMVAGRALHEARFGRAREKGAKMICDGVKNGRKSSDKGEFQRAKRMEAFRAAITADPNAGPSKWAVSDSVKHFWRGAAKPKEAALKFWDRYEERIRQELPLS